MPRSDHGWSSGPHSSTALRIGAGITVLAAHMAVVAAIYWMPEESPPSLLEPDAVMVSVIEAPVPQIAQAEQEATPQPEPEPEQEPEPEVVPPEPEPEVVPPEPEPIVEPEPEPEPEPVVEPPPQPEPAPQVKPKPKPEPKPKPKPEPKPKPKPKVEKPVESPKPAPTTAPPSGAPEGAKVTQAPVQGPPPDQPIMVSSVEYVGRRPMPEYPTVSRRFREEGRVVVLVEINTSGIVESATVDTSSGFARLDQSALAAARKARFKPLMRNGVAYPAKAKLPFDFVMRN